MLPKLVDVKYQSDYRIWLSFADGTKGEVDLESELWGEMFEPLKSKELFSQVVLNMDLETIIWPNGADLAPEFLYQQLFPSYELKPKQKSGVA